MRQVRWSGIPISFRIFPQFIVIHTVKGFGIVNKSEIDVFLELSCFFSMIQRMLAFWSRVPLPFLNPAWTSGSSQFTYCWNFCTISKTTEWSLFISKAKHSISQYSKSRPQPLMLKKLKLMFLWRLIRPPITNTQKRWLLHHRGWECKSRKSRDTCNNR